MQAVLLTYITRLTSVLQLQSLDAPHFSSSQLIACRRKFPMDRCVERPIR